MAYLLQTRRRRFFSLVTILTIIVICGFAIPLVIILNVNEYTEQSVTTKNLTTSTLSTININGSNITSWGSL